VVHKSRTRRITPKDVEFARTCSQEEAVARLNSIIEEGLPSIVMLQKPHAAKWQTQEARAHLTRIGCSVVRVYYAFSIWQPDLFMRVK